jgi:ankyrin repeat protein
MCLSVYVSIYLSIYLCVYLSNYLCAGSEASLISLRKYYSNFNIFSENGDSPLMYASISGHVDCIRYLLSIDVDINLQNQDGLTALMFSSSRSHVEVEHVFIFYLFI